MLFGWFKRETQQEMLDRSAKEMGERIVSGWKEKDSNYENVYNQEMRRLRTLQSNIVSPPWYVPKKEKYRNEKIPLLIRMTKECKNFFVSNIDNQMKEADVFAKKMDTDTKNNFFADPEVRDDFLEEAASVRGEQGLRKLLQKEIKDPVGEMLNPSVFQKYHDMDGFIKTEKAEKEKRDAKSTTDEEKTNSKNVFRDHIHRAIDGEFKRFSWGTLLEYGLEAEDMKEFNKISEALRLLQEGVSKEDLIKVVNTLQLTTVENSPLSDILRDRGVSGYTGLDFLMEFYFDTLKDVVTYKALVRLDREAIKIVEKEGISVLNLKKYAELNALKKSLSRAISEFVLWKDDMKQDYKIQIDYRKRVY